MVDAAKCIGCRTCEITYVVAHQQNRSCASVSSSALIPRIRVIKDDTFTAAIACHQREDVLCANVCPTHAVHREHGHIFVGQAHCISCKSYVLACPSGAMNVATRSSRVQAIKCDLCWHHEVGPACVEARSISALQCVDTVSIQRQRLRSQSL